jgi:hypothetical protein
MIEGIIMALIYICLIVLVIYVAFWVLGQIGVAFPEQVQKIIWIIVALLCLLVLLRVLIPGLRLASDVVPRIVGV